LSAARRFSTSNRIALFKPIAPPQPGDFQADDNAATGPYWQKV